MCGATVVLACALALVLSMPRAGAQTSANAAQPEPKLEGFEHLAEQRAELNEAITSNDARVRTTAAGAFSIASPPELDETPGIGADPPIKPIAIGFSGTTGVASFAYESGTVRVVSLDRASPSRIEHDDNLVVATDIGDGMRA